MFSFCVSSASCNSSGLQRVSLNSQQSCARVDQSIQVCCARQNSLPAEHCAVNNKLAHPRGYIMPVLSFDAAMVHDYFSICCKLLKVLCGLSVKLILINRQLQEESFVRTLLNSDIALMRKEKGCCTNLRQRTTLRIWVLSRFYVDRVKIFPICIQL